MPLGTIAVGLGARPAAAPPFATLPTPTVGGAVATIVLTNREHRSLANRRRRTLGSCKGGAYEGSPDRVDSQRDGRLRHLGR
ncbi:MAG: hypothetical protein ABGY72_25800, partial [bacterium]